MEKVDNRARIFELEEIFKYKSLIERSDLDVLKKIVYDVNKTASVFHGNFIKLVTMEENHELTKAEFYKLKDALIVEMKQYLQSEVMDKNEVT